MTKKKKKYTSRILHQVRAFCWHPKDDESYDMYIIDNPPDVITFKCTRCKREVSVGVE